MRRALFILLIVLFATPVAALVVEEDTVWSGEMSFAEDVKVLPGATLTISAGSRIHFEGARLEVAGRLLARDVELTGDAWGGLLLKGGDATAVLEKSVIKGAKTGIFVQGGAPLLEDVTLTGNEVGIELRGKAAGRVARCRFSDNSKVGLFVKDDSTTSVVDCYFAGNGRYGAYLYHALPQTFQGNVFVDNATGLMIAYHGSNPDVSDNRFEQNQIAIQIDRAARPSIRGNLVRGNQTGLYIYRRSDPLVSGNRIEGNAVGLLVAYSSYPQVTGNDFIDNQLALKLEFQSALWEDKRGAEARAGETAARSAFAGQGMRTVTEDDRRATQIDGKVNAGGNWWGKAGSAELKRIGSDGNPSFIHDGRDQAKFVDDGASYPLDQVIHSPWSETAVTEVRP